MVSVVELVGFIQQEIRLAMQQSSSLPSAIDRAAVAEVRTGRIMEFIETRRAPQLTEIGADDINRIAKELIDKSEPTVKWKPELYISMGDLDEDDAPRLEPKCCECGATIEACNAQTVAYRRAVEFYRKSGMDGLAARTKAKEEYPDLKHIKPIDEEPS